MSQVIKNRKLKEKIQFKQYYKITDTEQYGLKPSYFNSNTQVALNAYLPSKFDKKGSCAIEFCEMGTMVTLGHDLIKSLIEENKDSSLEAQILNYYDDKTEKAFIIIGTSSLHLKKETYNQAISILKDFSLPKIPKSIFGFLRADEFGKNVFRQPI